MPSALNKPKSSIQNKAFEILDYIAVIRPMLLVPVWTMLLIGYYRAEMAFTNPNQSEQVQFAPFEFYPQLELVKTFIIYSMLMGAVYILNQICDVKTDSVNNKLYLVAKGYVNNRVLKIEIAALSMGASFFTICYFSDKPFYIGLVFLSALLGSIYSLPPFRLKGRAIFDLLTNICGYGFVAFFAGWLSKSKAELNWMAFGAALPYALFVAAAFINTTLPDIEGDRENGDSTTGTLLGVKKSCFLSAFFIILAALISWAIKDKLALTISLFSLPLFVIMAIRAEIKIVTMTTKVSLLALSVAIGIKMPYYLLLLLGTIVSVKWYYWLRFRVKYP